MKIKVIAVGKLKESFYRDACDEYLKRLSRYVGVEVAEVPDTGIISEAQVVIKEIPQDSYVVALDIKGLQFSSVDIAKFLQDQQMKSIKRLIFIIGGSEGLHKSVLKLADISISFGKITLPHNLARVVLLEQLYRAHKILKNEPYHK